MNKNKKWSMNVALVYLSIHLNTSSNDNTSLSWLSSEELINKQTEEPSCSNLLSKLRLMTCMFGLYCQMVMTTMYQPFITFSGFLKTRTYLFLKWQDRSRQSVWKRGWLDGKSAYAFRDICKCSTSLCLTVKGYYEIFIILGSF